METRIMIITKAKGHTEKKKIPALKITGSYLEGYGFKWKKLVAVKYSYGSIELELHEAEVDLKRIRSKSGFVRVCRNHAIKKVENSPIIIVKGYWLNDMGFPTGTAVVVTLDSKKIQIRAINMATLKQEGFSPS
jgi:hypothetical protein